MKLSISSLTLLTIFSFALLACNKSSSSSNNAALAPQVTVIQPQEREVRDQIQLDGQVAASDSVNLVARISGYLQASPFREGDQVKKGQLLFVIEPAPYQQQVKLAQAQLDQARAEARRQDLLIKENATAQSSVDTAKSSRAQAEANLALANINLGYTEVRAPFDGVIGKRTVDAGNYVGASPGGTVLATLQKLRPAYVNFTINERELLRLRKAMASKYHNDPKGQMVGKLKVAVALQGEARPSETGVLDFIDNDLASGTGTLSLRASFANKNLHLIPGLYSKVYIDLGDPHKALLLPAALIMNDQLGDYVYVLDKDDRVTRRNISTGATFGQQREVTAGLAVSDRVISQGLSNVSVGKKVIAQTDSNSPSAK